jgi:hypothetical protein
LFLFWFFFLSYKILLFNLRMLTHIFKTHSISNIFFSLEKSMVYWISCKQGYFVYNLDEIGQWLSKERGRVGGGI